MTLKTPTRERERGVGEWGKGGKEIHYIQVDASNFVPVLKAMHWLQA